MVNLLERKRKKYILNRCMKRDVVELESMLKLNEFQMPATVMCGALWEAKTASFQYSLLAGICYRNCPRGGEK